MSIPPHRATPEQWGLVEQYADVDCYHDSCLIELRARVEALEARNREDADAWTGVRRANSELRNRLAAAEQRISELEALQQPVPDATGRAIKPPDLTVSLLQQPGEDDIAYSQRVYLAGWAAAMAAATCPHIRSSDEGTSYCALAEATAAASPPDHFPDAGNMARPGSLLEAVAWKVAKFFSESRLGADCTPFARDIIRAMADWMPERAYVICNGSQWAELLRKEADR